MTIDGADKLRGLRVLLVEDEALIAELVQDMLADLGCEVIGPALTLDRAQQLAHEEAEIGAALLDVNIKGQQVYPFASMLAERKVPIAFLTGSSKHALPATWQSCPTVQKPLSRTQLAEALRTLRGSQPSG
jgi:DNA-binding response OmpR family regulator